MVWICKKHGKACQSYVKGICEEFNDKKITPKNIDKFKEDSVQEFKDLVKWVEL